MDVEFILDGSTIRIVLDTEENARKFMFLLHRMFVDSGIARDEGTILRDRETGEERRTGIFENELPN